MSDRIWILYIILIGAMAALWAYSNIGSLSLHNCYQFFPFDVVVLYTYSVINGYLSCADISGIWCHLARLEVGRTKGDQTSLSSPLFFFLLAVPWQLFCFSSLVILNLVCCYLLLFLFNINIKKVNIDVKLAGDHLCWKLLFTWLSLVMSLIFLFSFLFSHKMSWMRSWT